MTLTPEQEARQNIDRQLADAGWMVHDRDEANVHAGRGVAIRHFPMKSGHGEVDYLFFLDAVAAGVVEAKKEGALTYFFSHIPKELGYAHF